MFGSSVRDPASAATAGSSARGRWIVTALITGSPVWSTVPLAFFSHPPAATPTQVTTAAASSGLDLLTLPQSTTDGVH